MQVSGAGVSAQPWFRLCVVALCVTALAISPFALLPALVGAHGSGDFQWSGAHLLSQGVDPFDAVLRRQRAGLLLNQNPNYLHLLYIAMLPLGVLPFSVARVLWAVANVAMAVTVSWRLGRAAGLDRWQQAGLLGLFLSSGPFVFAVGGGQQTLMVLFLSVLAATVRSRLGAGLALALALTKYSFAPIALVLWVRGRGSAVLVAAVASVVALVTFAWVTPTSFLQVALGPLAVGRTMARGSADVMTLTGLALDDPRAPVSYVVAAVTCLVLVWVSRRLVRDGDWVDALAAGCLVSLVTFPHLLYDYCVLLPVLVSALRMRGRSRLFVCAVVVFFWHTWLVGGLPFTPYHPVGVVVSFALLTACLLVMARQVPPRAAPAPHGTPAESAATAR